MRTAGEILRSQLAAGVGKQTLAKRLAGDDATAAEIQRWRYIVTRAAKGSEPNIQNAVRIGELFGEEISLVERVERPATELPLARQLAELAENVDVALNRQAQVLTGLAGIEAAVVNLTGAIQALEREVHRTPRGRGREVG